MLSLILSGCSLKTTQTVTETEIVLITPPEYMLEQCTQTPVPKKGTNKDLVEYILSLQEDFNLCNKKLRLLREYYTNSCQ